MLPNSLKRPQVFRHRCDERSSIQIEGIEVEGIPVESGHAIRAVQ
jgi:hypothetical protein